MQATLMGTSVGGSQGQQAVAVDSRGYLFTVRDANIDSTQNIGVIRIEQNSLYNTVTISRFAGATSLSNGQMVASTAVSTFVPARSTRRSVLLRNTDATNSAFWGVPTLTSLNGMLLRGGESVSVTYTGLIQVISAAGAPTVSYADEFDNP